MATISKGKEVVTLINVFIVEPRKARLVVSVWKLCRDHEECARVCLGEH